MASRQPRRYADLSIPRTRWDLNVEIPEDGMRLDLFLAKRVRWKSRTELQSMVDEGQVTVNGRVRKSGVKLRTSDRVEIEVPLREGEADPATIPIEILHDDGMLLCVNKQPGIVVHPVGRHQLDNLLSALHARYRDPTDPKKDRVPHVCHRIDKNTSGVFLVAFDEKLKADVSLQFERREVRKQYLAIVHGVPDPDQGEIDAPILYDEATRPKLCVHDSGQPSQTGYEVVESFGHAALVRFLPRTGRTHQIRIHSAWIGHPLLCDPEYGHERSLWGRELSPTPPPDAPDAPPLLTRCALHSASLTVRHPRTGELVTFEAPLPDDLVQVVDALRPPAPRPA